MYDSHILFAFLFYTSLPVQRSRTRYTLPKFPFPSVRSFSYLPLNHDTVVCRSFPLLMIDNHIQLEQCIIQ